MSVKQYICSIIGICSRDF